MPAKEKNAAECSDSALMLLFSDGELEAFDRLYARHKESIFRFFYFGTNGDKELSVELFQDVWLTIVRGRKRFTKDVCFIDWLRHVAWARLYDHLRMYPLIKQSEPDFIGEHANVFALPGRCSVDALMSSVSGEKELLEQMQKLTDEQCEVVLLRYCFRMDLSEIASFLDVARTAVSRLHEEAVVSLRRISAEAG